MTVECIVPVAKFLEYIFKPDATHGKEAIFRSLGYDASHSETLTQIYAIQAAEAYAMGKYTLSKLDVYGQRIIVEVVLSGIGVAEGRVSYIKSGWMLRSDGKLYLITPFTGFTQ